MKDKSLARGSSGLSHNVYTHPHAPLLKEQARDRRRSRSRSRSPKRNKSPSRGSRAYKADHISSGAPLVTTGLQRTSASTSSSAAPHHDPSPYGAWGSHTSAATATSGGVAIGRGAAGTTATHRTGMVDVVVSKKPEFITKDELTYTRTSTAGTRPVLDTLYKPGPAPRATPSRPARAPPIHSTTPIIPQSTSRAGSRIFNTSSPSASPKPSTGTSGGACPASLVRISVQDYQVVDPLDVKRHRFDPDGRGATEDQPARKRRVSGGAAAGNAGTRGSRRASTQDKPAASAGNTKPAAPRPELKVHTTNANLLGIGTSGGRIGDKGKKKSSGKKGKSKKKDKNPSPVIDADTLTAVQRAAAFITRTELQQLTALGNPPAAVTTLLRAVAALFRKGKKYLAQEKFKFLRDRHILRDLAQYNTDSVTPQMLYRVLVHTEKPEFTREKMVHAAGPAGDHLHAWVIAVVKSVRDRGLKPETPRKVSKKKPDTAEGSRGHDDHTDSASTDGPRYHERRSPSASPRPGTASSERGYTAAVTASPKRDGGERPTTPRRDEYQLLNEHYDPSRHDTRPWSPQRRGHSPKKSPRGNRHSRGAEQEWEERGRPGAKAWATPSTQLGQEPQRDGDARIPDWVQHEMSAHIHAAHDRVAPAPVDAHTTTTRDRTRDFERARSAGGVGSSEHHTYTHHHQVRPPRPLSAAARTSAQTADAQHVNRFELTGSLRPPPHRQPVDITVVSPPPRARVGKAWEAGTGIRLEPKSKARRRPGSMYEPYGRISAHYTDYDDDSDIDDYADGNGDYDLLHGVSSSRYLGDQVYTRATYGTRSPRSPRGAIPLFPGEFANKELTTVDHIDRVLTALRAESAAIYQELATQRHVARNPALRGREIRAHAPRALSFDARSPRYREDDADAYGTHRHQPQPHHHYHDGHDVHDGGDDALDDPGMATQMARGVAMYEAAVAANGGIRPSTTEIADIRRPDVYNMLTSGYDRLLTDLRRQELEIQQKAAMLEREKYRDPVDHWYELADVSFSAELARLNRKQGRR